MGDVQPVWLRVDFGLIETSAALCGSDGSIQMVRLGDTAHTMPSGVYFSPTAGLEAGTLAHEHGLLDPSRYVAQPHRCIENDWPACELGGTAVPVHAVVAAVLRAVIAQAQAACGWTLPAGLELTHPRAWTARQTQVLVAAAHEAGYPADRLRLYPKSPEYAATAAEFAVPASAAAGPGAPAAGGVDFAKTAPPPRYRLGTAAAETHPGPRSHSAADGGPSPAAPAPPVNPEPSESFSRLLSWFIVGTVVLVAVGVLGAAALLTRADRPGSDFETIAVGASSGVGHMAVDPARKRLYTYDSSDRTVSVVDTASKTSIAAVPVEKSVRDIATDPRTGTLWLLLGGDTNGDTALAKIDPQTRATLGSVPVPSTAEGMAVHPVTGEVYIAQANGDTVDPSGASIVATIFDPDTLQVSGRIMAPGNGHDVAVDPNTGLVYVVGSASVRTIDPNTRSVVREDLTPVGGRQIVIDPVTHVAYMSADTSILALDLTTGISTVIDVGHGVYWIAIDSDLGHLYASYSGGGPARLTVIDTTTRAIANTIEMPRSAEGITADPLSHTVYVRPFGKFVYLVEPCTATVCN
ncbi:YncE family protein [Nocardia sp. NPDC055321]